MAASAFLGCDLARYGAHWAVLLDDQGEPQGSPQRFRSTPADLERLRTWALAHMDPAAELRVIVEPTGPATAYVQDFWHQHAVRVDCVIPLRVKRFRQPYQSHTKTDGLDAFILAKYAHTYRNLLYPAIIPTDDRLGILRDSIKEVWRFSRDLGSVEKRATALVDQWIPEWGTIAPSLHQANGSATYREVWQVFAETPHWTVTTERIQRHLLAVRPMTVAERSRKRDQTVATQAYLDRLLAHHAFLRERKQAAEAATYALYRALDPDGVVRSLVGVGRTLAPFCLALAPAIMTVRSRQALKAYVGFDLATNQSNRTLLTNGHLTKAGPSWARWALYLAADVARQWDPQLAHVYYRAMMTKGKCHQQAVLETAVHLLRRLAQVVKTGQPYEPRDLEGHPMPAGRDRRQFIADHLTVPDSVRNRTRSHRPA